MSAEGSVSKMLFGSAARGDHDAYSDRDLLLVGSKNTELRKISGELEAFGWSCSSYPWRSFDNLCDKGGYFVEHLRREGKILDDLDDVLSHRLATARSKTCYEAEIKQAQSLFGVLEYIPNTCWGASWALDVLMVAVRSYGFAVLAHRGMFVFNYAQMLDRLVYVGLLSRVDKGQLLALRFWKVRYRSGIYAASWTKALPLIRSADRVLKLDLHSQHIAPIEYLEKAAVTCSSDIGWYANTRILEAIDKCYPSVLPRNLSKKLIAPQEYAGSLSGIHYPIWRSYVLERIMGLESVTK